MKRLLFSIVALCACNSDSSAPADKPVDKPIRYVGVEPSKFDCGSIASVTALGGLLGGTTTKIDSPPSPERDIARRCEYDVLIPNGAIAPPEPGPHKPDPDAAPKRIDAHENWSFDFDCREDYQKSAQREMAQYKQKNADAIAYYNEIQKDAGVAATFKEKDAGAETHAAPTPAVDVQVGKTAVDVGQGLFFVDDDAPCFVRVIGPDPARRLELAKLVAKNLTFTNAPMKPRAVQ